MASLRPFQRGLSLHTAAGSLYCPPQPPLCSSGSSPVLCLCSVVLEGRTGGPGFYSVNTLFKDILFYRRLHGPSAACTRSLLYTFNQHFFRLKAGRFRFRSLSAPVPLPPPGRPRAFHRHLASVAPRGLLLPRAPPGLRLRHGSRPAFLPLRPPASRRHGCLSLPAQHGEVLRGRGRRPAPAAALRLLRHARLARLHGGCSQLYS